MRQKIYEVNGFAFTDPQEYEEAKKESESIEYMKANTDFNDLSQVTKLYLKLVEHKSMRTVVGYTFLKELQDSIIKKDFIDKDNLPGIQIIKRGRNIDVLSSIKDPEKKQEGILTDYRIRLRNSRIISIFLLVIIIIMMLIAAFGQR